MTTMTDHVNRAHASKSASSAPRVIECPSSYILSLGLPDKATTSYSEEGTTGHEIAEQVIKCLFETGELPEFDIPNDDSNYTELFEMYTHACSYSMYAYNVCKPYMHYPHKIFYEAKLVASEKRDIWGSGDFLFIADMGDCVKIIIDDYKYGIGVVVNYDPNFQLIQYAWGAIVMYALGRNLCDIELIIHQPRITDTPYHVTYTQEEICDLIAQLDAQYTEIEEWEAIIGAERIKETVTSPEQRLLPLLDAGIDLTDKWKAGKHCQFCKHKLLCSVASKEKAQKQIDLYKAALKKMDGKKFPGEKKKDEQFKVLRELINDEPNFRDAMIAAAFARSNMSTLLEACYDYCIAMARQDTPFLGTKLVEKKANDALDFGRLGEAGIEKELLKMGIAVETVTKKEFPGITVLKDKFGVEGIKHLLIPDDKKQVGYALVPDDHEKPAVSMKAEKNKKITKAIKEKLR